MKLQRGTRICEVCLKVVALTNDGGLRSHRFPGKARWHCKGSGTYRYIWNERPGGLDRLRRIDSPADTK